jgi:thiosulfate/3-mercaptopyruvate sulfurtransferase
MIYATLITTQDLFAHLHDESWVIVDCRFSLDDTPRGERDYLYSHIPRAVYAQLDRHLSAPQIPGRTGRHPWPSVEQATELFSSYGITSDVQVIAYDDAGGSLAAARLWWILRWLGHEVAAVLDGGWHKWVKEGLPTSSIVESQSPKRFISKERPELLVSAAEIDRMRQDVSYRVVDARSPHRYHGQNEIIDMVAGHIPGAVNAFFMDNLTDEGVFKSTEELKSYYQMVLGKTLSKKTAFYCGSGVTSALDLLAMYHAGLGEACLYPGSWSEWITDSNRPVATD